MYWALKPISTPSPAYSSGSDSRASPSSGDEALTSSRPSSRLKRTARPRSEERRLTRRIALCSASRPDRHLLVAGDRHDLLVGRELGLHHLRGERSAPGREDEVAVALLEGDRAPPRPSPR